MKDGQAFLNTNLEAASCYGATGNSLAVSRRDLCGVDGHSLSRLLSPLPQTLSNSVGLPCESMVGSNACLYQQNFRSANLSWLLVDVTLPMSPCDGQTSCHGGRF